jgi:hypothetical protein
VEPREAGEERETGRKSRAWCGKQEHSAVPCGKQEQSVQRAKESEWSQEQSVEWETGAEWKQEERAECVVLWELKQLEQSVARKEVDALRPPCALPLPTPSPTPPPPPGPRVASSPRLRALRPLHPG